jgi:hypothetical protein
LANQKDTELEADEEEEEEEDEPPELSE